jgi:hypothetical protein
VAYADETSRSQLRGQLRIRLAHARASPHSLFTLSRGTVGTLVIDFAGAPCQSRVPPGAQVIRITGLCAPKFAMSAFRRLRPGCGTRYPELCRELA